MVGSDITTYTNRFCDLANLCSDMVALESKKIERYIWGLSPQIQSSVLASRPITFDSAKELAQSLIDHRKPQNPTIPAPVPPKANNNKKGWSKRKRGASQESSKKQQLVAINAATVTPVVPANPLPAKLMLEPFRSATNATSTTTDLARTCSALTATGRGIQPVSARFVVVEAALVALLENPNISFCW